MLTDNIPRNLTDELQQIYTRLSRLEARPTVNYTPVVDTHPTFDTLATALGRRNESRFSSVAPPVQPKDTPTQLPNGTSAFVTETLVIVNVSTPWTGGLVQMTWQGTRAVRLLDLGIPNRLMTLDATQCPTRQIVVAALTGTGFGRVLINTDGTVLLDAVSAPLDTDDVISFNAVYNRR